MDMSDSGSRADAVFVFVHNAFVRKAPTALPSIAKK